MLPFTTLSSLVLTNPYMQQAVSHIAAKFTDQNKPGIAWWDASSIIEDLDVIIKLLETVECDLTQYQIQRHTHLMNGGTSLIYCISSIKRRGIYFFTLLRGAASI